MNLLPFSGHKMHGPWCCSGIDEWDRDCIFCVVSYCTRCHGAELSLPTDCPGHRMYPEAEEDIRGGLLDYRAGRGWVQEPSWYGRREKAALTVRSPVRVNYSLEQADNLRQASPCVFLFPDGRDPELET